MQRTLKELADLVGGRALGDGATVLLGVNGIDEAGPGEITFVANPRYASRIRTTKASAVIIADAALAPPIPAIVAADPSHAFMQVAAAFVDRSVPPRRGVHPTAVVGKAALGKDVGIGPHCVVEDGASIGDGTVLEAQVYVGRGARLGRECRLHAQSVVREECVLGDRVILQPGAVVGSDGFGYATVKGAHLKIPQTGIVVIEDDVELGANTTVDRARFGKTVIHRGAKLDNLVMVGHNVVIGEHCLIVAQVGISGSAKLGHHVVLGGQTGVAGHIEVGDGAVSTGQAGLAKSLPPGAVVSGTPARPRQRHMRGMGMLDRLPDELREIRRRIAELEKRLKAGPQ